MGDIPAKEFVLTERSPATEDDFSFPHGSFLYLEKTQKDGKQFLHIQLSNPGIGALPDEEYFNYQEVVMLDIAISKAINFFSP